MRKNTLITIVGIMLAAMVAVPASAQLGQLQGLLGDVTLDGQLNVLDVQKTINEALGQLQATAEADLDGNAAVNVTDVQNMINSALGTGGVFQKVSGLLANVAGIAEQLRVTAIADNGLTIVTDVAENGQFNLSLRTGLGWSITIVDTDGKLRGSVEFTVDGETTTTLPLPELSIGEVLDLGQFPLGLEQLIPTDVRDLIAGIMPTIDLTDADANGIPDVLDELISQVLDGVTQILVMFQGHGIPGQEGEGTLDAEALKAQIIAQIAACLPTVEDVVTHPSLTDDEGDNTIDFITPVFDCMWNSIISLFGGNGFLSSFEPMLQGAFTEQIPGWLDSLNHANVTDANNNGIPDFMESSIHPEGGDTEGEVEGEAGHHGHHPPLPVLDSDGDGIPDWLEADAPVSIDAPDADHDGIPDAIDVDSNNDGTPDYADANPLAPFFDHLLDKANLK